MKHYKSDVERFAQLEYCEFQTADTLHSLEMNAAYIELKESSTAKDAEIEQLKAENAVLRKFVTGTSDFARECIAQIGGTQ